jgi:hypothetical protein
LKERLAAQLGDLRAGSVILFDNLSFFPKGTDPVVLGSSIKAQLDPKGVLEKNWLDFLSQLFEVCKDFPDLKFVVVAEDISSIESMVLFDEVITLSELSPEAATEMVTTLQPNLKLSSFVPVDPRALQIASNRLPEDIIAFTYACNIGQLRTIAQVMINCRMDRCMHTYL